MGIRKLNTTAYHPQCDGMVERFNRTLKTILRKHAAMFGPQWDRYLPGVLWAYRNVPHESTGEKPSYLLFGVDCRTPTEAAYIPPSSLYPADVSEYKEALCLSLSAAKDLAAKNIQKAQTKYKKYYDKARGAQPASLSVGKWVLVRFPQDETGSNRKLSRPWHGPYRIASKQDPDVCVGKVYFPQEPHIRVHELRVKRCPANFPASFYWYGGKRRGPGRHPSGSPSSWMHRTMLLMVRGHLRVRTMLTWIGMAPLRARMALALIQLRKMKIPIRMTLKSCVRMMSSMPQATRMT